MYKSEITYSLPSSNKMAFLNLIILSVSLTLFSTVHCAPPLPTPPPTPPPTPSSSFAYAVVSFQWPMGLCAITQCKKPDRPEDFRLHGVWPTQADGTSVTCEEKSYSNGPMEGIQKRMASFWPDYVDDANKLFWIREWEKHGSCSKQSQEEYFTNSLDLFEKQYKQILRSLSTKGISPQRGSAISFKVMDVYDALHEGLKLIPMLSCKSRQQKMYLVEVRLCANPDLKTFRDCPAEKFSGCGLVRRMKDQKVFFYAE